jgi:hypothetical protein
MSRPTIRKARGASVIDDAGEMTETVYRKDEARQIAVNVACQAKTARFEADKLYLLEDVIRLSSQVYSSRRYEIARLGPSAHEATSTSAALASLVCLVSGSNRH